MSRYGLTPRELDRLAVLRVVAMAAEPDAVKVLVWRDDVLTLLAAVDRLVSATPVQTLMIVRQPAPGALLAGSMTVHQQRRRRRWGRWPW